MLIPEKRNSEQDNKPQQTTEGRDRGVKGTGNCRLMGVGGGVALAQGEGTSAQLFLKQRETSRVHPAPYKKKNDRVPSGGKKLVLEERALKEGGVKKGENRGQGLRPSLMGGASQEEKIISWGELGKNGEKHEEKF